MLVRSSIAFGRWAPARPSTKRFVFGEILADGRARFKPSSRGVWGAAAPQENVRTQLTEPPKTKRVDAINSIGKKDFDICNNQNFNTKKNLDIKDINDIECSFYLRIFAEDVSGVMAEITNILANQNISIESVTQHESDRDNTIIPIVMITNSVKGELINNAIKLMENLHHVKDAVHLIRVLKSDE